MFNLKTWMDIEAMHNEGHTIKQIARHPGHSRNTVRRVWCDPAPASFTRSSARKSAFRNSPPKTHRAFPIRARQSRTGHPQTSGLVGGLQT